MATRKAPAKDAPEKKTAPRKRAAPKPTRSEPSAEPATVPMPEDAGYIGDVSDPTPNEHYTLPGVLAGKPVPEHDKPVG